MEPLERLTLMLGGDNAPALGAEVIQSLLEDSAREDEEGRDPLDPEWEPTYDFDAAAAVGFQMKAAKVAGGYDFAVEGKSFSRSQAFEHFQQMARFHALRTSGGMYSIRLSRGGDVEWGLPTA